MIEILYTQQFLSMLGEAGIESVKLPPRAPNLNPTATIERRQRLGGLLNYYHRMPA